MFGDDEGQSGAGGGGGLSLQDWLAIGQLGSNIIGGGMAAGERKQKSQAELAQEWQQYLLGLAQRNSEQGDERGKFAARLGGTIAMQPLADQGFTALQNRFRQGPATFGQTGAQNMQTQSQNAAYTPGQNPSMQNYAATLDMLQNRFLTRPVYDNDEWRRQMAGNRGWGQSNRRGLNG